MRLMSMRLVGRASRKFIAGTRLCPPARIFPSSPCVARRSSASSTVRGAKYLNETGFIRDEHAKRPSQQIKRHERSDRERVERQRESNAVPCCRGLFLAYHDGRTVVTGQLPTGYRRATRRGIQLPDFTGYEREETCDAPVHPDKTRTIGRRRRSARSALCVVGAGAWQVVVGLNVHFGWRAVLRLNNRGRLLRSIQRVQERGRVPRH